MGIKSFLLRKWTDNSDTTWAFDPNSDVNQVWPVNEQMRYTNATLKTAAMGGVPARRPVPLVEQHPDRLLELEGPARGGRPDNYELADEWHYGSERSPAVGPPLKFALGQNYPNPFNPSTQINYTVPQKSAVTLKVYNVLGMEVATLVSGIQDAGEHAATFNAASLSSGVYFYRLQAGGLSLTRKMLFVK